MTAPSLFVVIYARDLERAVSFYATLGFAFTLEKHPGGPEHYACPLGGGSVFEIYPWRKEPDRSFLSDSSIRLTLRVDGLDALLDLLRPLARRVEPPDDDPPRSARVIDPEGNQVLLIEQVTSSLH